MQLLIAGLLFIVGTFIGSFIQRQLFIYQEWKVLRWNDESLGYRTVPTGGKIYKNQRVVMSLEIDTSEIPKEGMKVE